MIPVQFPPGVTTLLSKTSKIINWRDGNLVRWDDGVTLRPVGGWEKTDYGSSPFASRLRRVHKWVGLDGITYTAYLCEAHVYVDGGGLTDITPVGGMAVPSGDVAGYGELDYSDDTYGTPRSGFSTIQRFSHAFTLDNWGEDLCAMTSADGRLLKWSPSAPGTKLTAVPGAPINNRSFVITPEHHVVLMGMGGNFGDFGWCSQEDINDWNFADTTNTAGMYTVDPLSPIVAAQASDLGFVVFTPAMSYLVDYIGLPYIYRRRPIGKVPIPMSAASTCAIPEGIMWVSVEGFWLYNGSAPGIVPCPIWDVVNEKMDFSRTVLESHIVNLLNRGEVWWFWVDPSVNLYANRYIGLDYRSKVWMPGFLQRTCGLMYGNERHPIMSDGTDVWKHEIGFNYPGALYMPYLESQTLNTQGGDYWTTITKILPEVMGDKTALAFSLAMNNDRTENAVQKYSQQRTINGHGMVDIRETARDLRLRIDMIKNSDWKTVGPILFDMKQRGKKK